MLVFILKMQYLERLAAYIRGNLGTVDRLKLVSLITIEVYALSIVLTTSSIHPLITSRSSVDRRRRSFEACLSYHH